MWLSMSLLFPFLHIEAWLPSFLRIMVYFMLIRSCSPHTPFNFVFVILKIGLSLFLFDLLCFLTSCRRERCYYQQMAYASLKLNFKAQYRGAPESVGWKSLNWWVREVGKRPYLHMICSLGFTLCMSFCMYAWVVDLI